MAQQWTNWAGSVTCAPARMATPADSAALADLVRTAPGPLRAVGSGHSFTPLVATEGTLVSLAGLNGMECLPGGEVRLGAGAQLGDIARWLDAQGLAFANMGDIDRQALGGALATATHGTGPSFGCYSSTLSALTLMDGRGQERHLQRGDGLFEAMAVGLGTGGMVTEAVMQTVPRYRLAFRRYAMKFTDILDGFDALMTSARNVEVYYIPWSGHGVVMESRETAAPIVPRTETDDESALFQLRLAGRLLGRFPRLRRKVIGFALPHEAEQAFTEDWLRVYPSDREGSRFDEAEFHVPRDAAVACLREITQTVERLFPQVYFPMEVRLVAEDDLWLSPFYRQPSCSIAVHHDAGRGFAAILAAIQPIFLRHGGRPHWGKLHSLTARDLAPLYPRFREAVEARRELDPEGRFLTPYMRAILGL